MLAVGLRVDSSSVKEARIVASAPALRPADLLTRAITRGSFAAAVDFSFPSPHADRAGADCIQTTVRRKEGYYAPHAAEIREFGANYLVAAVSCYGRLGCEARQFTEALARRVAAHRGLPSHHEIQFRLEGKVAVAVWERAARMTRYCLRATGAAAAEEKLDSQWAEPGLMEGLDALVFEP